MNSLTTRFRLFLIGVCALSCYVALGQKNSCDEYITLKNSARRSRSQLIFDVPIWSGSSSFVESTNGKLEINDGGLDLTVQFSFEFRNQNYAVPAGDILTITFADGSRNEFIYSGRHTSKGKIDFILMRIDNNENLIKKVEDKMFFEKILDVRMTSFRLRVDNDYRIIEISNFKSDLIRKTILCLLDHK